jgi:hypothetical protein
MGCGARLCRNPSYSTRHIRRYLRRFPFILESSVQADCCHILAYKWNCDYERWGIKKSLIQIRDRNSNKQGASYAPSMLVSVAHPTSIVTISIAKWNYVFLTSATLTALTFVLAFGIPPITRK